MVLIRKTPYTLCSHIHHLRIVLGIMNVQPAAHIVPVAVRWEMIQIMMPLLLLYIQILRSTKKRY